jgi:hypothetical protein
MEDSEALRTKVPSAGMSSARSGQGGDSRTATFLHAMVGLKARIYFRETTTTMNVPGLAAGRPDAPGFCSSNSAVGR